MIKYELDESLLFFFGLLMHLLPPSLAALAQKGMPRLFVNGGEVPACLCTKLFCLCRD